MMTITRRRRKTVLWHDKVVQASISLRQSGAGPSRSAIASRAAALDAKSTVSRGRLRMDLHVVASRGVGENAVVSLHADGKSAVVKTSQILPIKMMGFGLLEVGAPRSYCSVLDVLYPSGWRTPLLSNGKPVPASVPRTVEPGSEITFI